ncbi:hypothetical protein CY35_01G076900 [Sphagnum magellanicum]|nr:hypothetical protein CY35_01G076900 [Sphagnum magellanicum]
MGVLVKEKLQLQQQQQQAGGSVMLKDQAQCRRGGRGEGGVGLTTFVQLELAGEPPLPCGWEKCLDLQSGLIYFKDWNTGTHVYSDPRRQYCNLRPVLMNPRNRVGHDLRVDEDHDDSLNLSLNPPGANCLQQQQQSKGSTLSLTNCLSTSLALHHSHELSRRRRSDSSSSPAESSSPAAAATGPLMSSEPEAATSSCKRSISTTLGSQCSSECLTSPSTTMLHQDDEEEVQQPRSRSRLEPAAVHTLATEPVLLQVQPEACKEEEADAGVIMVAVGCKSCMMYIMLPKLHPSCPKCGNSDSLLDFASSLAMPKKQRVQKFNWVK